MTSSAPSLPHYLLRPPPGGPPDLVLRLADSSDLPALYAACFSDRSLGAFQRTMATVLSRQAVGRSFLLLAEQTGPTRIIGSIQLHLHQQRGEIAELIVAPEDRRQGVGTALMATTINVAYHFDLDSLEVGVEEDNMPAVRLYRRLGFARDRSMKVPGRGLAAIMVKELE